MLHVLLHAQSLQLLEAPLHADVDGRVQKELESGLGKNHVAHVPALSHQRRDPADGLLVAPQKVPHHGDATQMRGPQSDLFGADFRGKGMSVQQKLRMPAHTFQIEIQTVQLRDQLVYGFFPGSLSENYSDRKSVV